jgi:hypothetical protein
MTQNSDTNNNDLQKPDSPEAPRLQKAERRLRAVADSAYYAALQSIDERLSSEVFD